MLHFLQKLYITRYAKILRQKIEDSARVIYKFCTAFLCILCIFCTLFQKKSNTDLQAFCINSKQYQ